VFSNVSNTLAVEYSIPVRQEGTDSDPFRSHIDGEYVIVFLVDGHRPCANEVDVPVTVFVDKFRIANILVFHQRFVFLGNNCWTPDTIPLPSARVIDRNLEPPVRQHRILVVFDGDTVIPENDRLFGVLSWILVRANLVCLLSCGRIEVNVTGGILNGSLERAVFTREKGTPCAE
jgi:hypothetical protein